MGSAPVDTPFISPDGSKCRLGLSELAFFCFQFSSYVSIIFLNCFESTHCFLWLERREEGPNFVSRSQWRQVGKLNFASSFLAVLSDTTNPPCVPLLQTVQYDLDLDFETALVEEAAVFDDFAFIQDATNNLFVVASAADNKVAIVDLNANPPKADYVAFKNGAFEGRPRSRQVEWAPTTNYVWVSGPSDNDAFVIDFVEKKVVKSFSDVDVSKLLSVVNNHFLARAQRLHDHGYYPESSSAQAFHDDDNENNVLSIVALALSLVALLAVFTNLVLTAKNNRNDEASIVRKKSVQQSVA